jgi:hypothetical protein
MEEITSNEGRISRIELGTASTFQVIAALGAITLAILGLCNIATRLMLSVTAIVLGGGLLIGGGLAAARYTGVFPATESTAGEEVEGGGMALESLAGLAGLTLGILSLLGIVPRILLPTSAIVFGGAMLLGAGSMVGNQTGGTRSISDVASLTGLLGGSAAIALGILALNGPGQPYPDCFSLRGIRRHGERFCSGPPRFRFHEAKALFLLVIRWVRAQGPDPEFSK